MKSFNDYLVRGFSAILLGLLLVVWPDAAVVYLVIAIGALFFLPGLFSIVLYFSKGKEQGMMFPILGIGSLLLGLWLMIMPSFFVDILMSVLGVVLVLAGLHQIAQLVHLRSLAPVSAGLFFIPAIVLLAGLLVLLNPFAVATIPFIILGISCLVYGITEVITIIRFRKEIKKTNQITDAVIVEEETN